MKTSLKMFFVFEFFIKIVYWVILHFVLQMSTIYGTCVANLSVCVSAYVCVFVYDDIVPRWHNKVAKDERKKKMETKTPEMTLHLCKTVNISRRANENGNNGLAFVKEQKKRNVKAKIVPCQCVSVCVCVYEILPQSLHFSFAG